MVKIIKIGKIKRDPLRSELDFYLKKINSFTRLEIGTIKESKLKKKDLIIKDESENIKKLIKKNDYSICLSRIGNKFNSIQFSEKIDNILSNGKIPTFIIGGAYGISENLKSYVNIKLSFSDFTLQHDLIFIVLLEQIYRAFTIMKGLPYHK